LKEYKTLLTSDCYVFLFGKFSGEGKHEKVGVKCAANIVNVLDIN